MLLAFVLNKVRNFYPYLAGFSIPFTFENITKIRYGERAFDYLHLLLDYYISLREILKIESTILLYFTILSSRNKSNVRMFYYYAIKMNEA